MKNKVYLQAAWFFLLIIVLFNGIFYSTLVSLNSDFVSDFLLFDSLFQSKIYMHSHSHLIKYLFYLPLDLIIRDRLILIKIIGVFNYSFYFLLFFIFFKKTYSSKKVFTLCEHAIFLWVLTESLMVNSFLVDPFNRNLQISLFFLAILLLQTKNQHNALLAIIIFIGGLLFLSDYFLIIMFFIPIFISEAIVTFLERKNVFFITTKMLLMIVVSVVISSFLKKINFWETTSGNFNFISTDQLLFNLKVYFEGLINMFEISKSLLGFINLLILILSLAGLIGLFKFGLKNKIKWYLFPMIQFIIINLSYLFSNKVINLATTRYLIILPLTLSFGLYYLISFKKIKLLMIIILISLGLYKLSNNITKFKIIHLNKNSYFNNYLLINFLKEKNLSKGYSNYWDSSLNTFLSEKTIQIRQVICQNHKLTPHKWLSAENWYKPTNKDSYIIVNNNEENGLYFIGCTETDLINQFGNPLEKIDLSFYAKDSYLLIYDYDISYNF